jgi:hypothetical protein
MRSCKTKYIVYNALILSGLLLLQAGCGRTSEEGYTFVATVLDQSVVLRSTDLGMDRHYLPGAKIIECTVGPDATDHRVLTEDFYSACAPSVSYDAGSMVFAAQRSRGDTWQIYLMNLGQGKVRQITDAEADCTQPQWLPDGRVVFSQRANMPVVGPLHVLYVSEVDGSGMERITFHPNTTVASAVAADGRILVESEQVFPERGPKHLLALRPDGTKAELFYRSREGYSPYGKLGETTSGKVFFVESAHTPPGSGRIISVDYGLPLSTRQELKTTERGDVYSLCVMEDTSLLISFKPDNNEVYGLYRCNIATGRLEAEFQLEGVHIVEARLVRQREKSMQLPSVVDDSKNSGTFLCHDTECSVVPVEVDNAVDTGTFAVRVMGIEGDLGVVEVSEDGSFYIQVDANTPVRFESINRAGQTIRGPSAWMWVRPNERRSCIGCHEDRELAPENRVPDAIYDGLVTLPAGTRSEPIVLTDRNG